MKILWSIHLYPPAHNCGAEYVAHHVNKYLLSQGHQVRVMLLQYKGPEYLFEGVEVVPYSNSIDVYNWADIVFTHLDFTRHTMNVCQIIKKPVVHFMHNDSVEHYRFIDQASMPQYLVYNSYWMREQYGFKSKSTVLQPPCPAEYYRTLGVTGPYITLINTNENKGGYIFYRLAKAMPERRFLAVNGSYDDGGLMPDINAKLKGLPNVKFMDHSPNVREVYQQTRILLVLSRYESWGRVATEAMSNGIPVIYTPTPGLIENVGSGGTIVPKRGAKVVDDKTQEIVSHDGDTYDITMLTEAIRSLDRVDTYEDYTEAALTKYAQLNNAQNDQLNELSELLRSAQQDYRSFNRGHIPGNSRALFS